jgi:hypothetical protein
LGASLGGARLLELDVRLMVLFFGTGASTRKCL